MVVSVACRSKSVIIEFCQSKLCIGGLPLVRSKEIVGYGMFLCQSTKVHQRGCESHMQIFKIEGLILASTSYLRKGYVVSPCMTLPRQDCVASEIFYFR